jgi:serine protein kinase
MEALRDRTVKIDIPYVTTLNERDQDLREGLQPRTVRGKHIAPHTIEMAAMWAVLTRLEEPKHAGLTLLQKLKLYNGKTLPGFTETTSRSCARRPTAKGMHRHLARYVQDKISNALVASEATHQSVHGAERTGGGLASQPHHQRGDREAATRAGVVKEEYENIVKNEVQRAIAADEDALKRLCGNYIDNVKAYTQREKVRNKFTGQYEEPDERLMRSIEEKIDIPESRKDDFRREIMNYIGALSIDGKKFDYKTNERLHKALELKLFEDQKDTIKLTSLVSNVVDKPTRRRRSTSSRPPDPRLRLRRRERDRRAELRGEHLRAAATRRGLPWCQPSALGQPAERAPRV